MKAQIGKAALIVFLFLLCGAAAVAATGVINVTVRDQGGKFPQKPGAVVVLYHGTTVLATAPTDANGVASATIEDGFCTFEVNGPGGYWGTGSGTVVAGGTVDVAFQRREPFELAMNVFNGAVDVTNGTVDAGTALSIKVQVKNIGPTNRAARVVLKFDNDTDEPADFTQPSSAQTVLSGGGIKTYTFPYPPLLSYKPLLGGPWYGWVEVQTLIGGKWVVTDFVNWTALVTVNPGKANLSVTVLDQNGATVAGARVYRYPLAGGVPPIDMVTTDTNGVAAWPAPVDSMEYYMEAYVGRAFWSLGIIPVPLGSNTKARLPRREPFVTGVRVFNASTNADLTGSYVLTGTKLRIEVTVANRMHVDRESKVTLYVDRSRSSSWDFRQTSAQKTVPADGSAVFTFTYRPTSSGTFYRCAFVETYYSYLNVFEYTDLATLWSKAVTTSSSPPVAISGRVRTSGGDPMDNVVVRAIAGNGVTITAQDTTDSNGNYSFLVPYNWTGRVMVFDFPGYPAYAFYPSMRNYSSVRSARANQDFTGYAPIMISGHIRLPNTDPVSGVVVNASNGGGTSTTDGSGSYSLAVPGGPSGWTGFVTPSPAGYAFDPVYRHYSGITANQTNQDFTAYLGDTVDHLVITGPLKVGEGLSADYTCTAHYTSARTADVTLVTAWSENSSYASINSAGRLTTLGITSNKTVQITAAYGGKQATFTLTILYVASLTISGPTSVNESSSADYTCTARYSDGSTLDVTNTAQWSEDSSYASINSAGHLTTSAVSQNRSARITARYGGVTATLNITIRNL